MQSGKGTGAWAKGGVRQIARRAVRALGLQPRMRAPFAIVTRDRAEVATVEEEGAAYRFLVANPDDLVTQAHTAGALYEPEERALIRRHFPDGATFVDIGAHIGNHAIWAASALPCARVAAFEPTLGPHTQLCINVMLNGMHDRIDVRKLALSDRQGTTHIANSFVQMNNSARSMIGDGSFGERVATARGDDVVPPDGALFLKIDVEGHEMAVLAGLHRTFARRRPAAFVEVDDAHAGPFEQWLVKSRYVAVESFRRYETNCNYLILPQEHPDIAQSGAGLPPILQIRD